MHGQQNIKKICHRVLLTPCWQESCQLASKQSA